MYKCEICFEDRRTGPISIVISTRQTQNVIRYGVVCLPCVCKVIGYISDLQISKLATKEGDREEPVKIKPIRGKM